MRSRKGFTAVFVFTAANMDARSESILAKVHPELAKRVRIVVSALSAHDVRVISGYRTYDEQNVIYAEGRTKPGHIVTNARGGYSNHNFGLAVDLGIFDSSGKYLGDSPLYDLIPPAAHAAGLESGADWKHIHDRPHVQLPSDLIIKGSPTNYCRELFARLGLQGIFEHVSAAVSLPDVSEPQPTHNEGQGPQAGPSDPASQPPNLRVGSKGEPVALLQARLRALGYTLPVDGEFGDRTKTCVERFQAANHLDVDGICGPDTRKLLGL